MAAVLSLGFPIEVSLGQGLGNASYFGALAGYSLTNSGATEIAGSIGVAPGTIFTGSGSVTLTEGRGFENIHLGDAFSIAAQSDALAAYNAFYAMPCDFNMSSADLIGSTLTPGVYCFDSSLTLSSSFTLDWLADPSNMLFVFLVSGDLTSADGFSLLGSGESYMVATGNAVLGAGTSIFGSVVSAGSVQLGTGTIVACGSIVSLNSTVAMNGSTIDTCIDPPNEGGRPGAKGYPVEFDAFGSPIYASTVPEPTTLVLLLGPGFAILRASARRRSQATPTR